MRLNNARIALFLLLLAIALVGIGVVAASPSGQGTPTPQVIGCWLSNGTWTTDLEQCRDLLASQVPYATATPTPSATPSSTPTITPTPPIVIPTVTPWPTPTQEIATETPDPTEPPTKFCVLRADRSGVRIRSAPALDGQIVGALVQGDEYTALEFQADRDYLWMHHGEGWSAVYSYGTAAWWVAGTPGVDLCRDVPGWDSNLAPPPAFAGVQDGIHTIRLGWGADRVAPYFAVLDTLKCTIADAAGFDLCRAARVANPDIVLVARSLIVGGTVQDCPTPYYMDHPAEWFNAINFLPAPSEVDYIEIVNECWPNGADWDAVNDFMLGATIAANNAGYAVLAWSFFPAHPELEAWSHFCPWFEYARTARVDGRSNGVAFHLAGWYPEPLHEDMLWVNSRWVAGYHRLADSAIREACGFGLRGFPVYSTELAWTDGYTELPANVQAVAYVYTGEKLAGDDLVTGFHAWNQGLCSSWLCLDETFPLIWGY
jgi:hypothetical protein